MVFNPNLEGGIRFDQPVQQPTSPIANIVQGLGIFNRREASAPSAGDRYDAAVANFRSETGVGGVADWTEADRRAFAAAYPQFADRPYGTANEGIDLEQNAITLEEQRGGGGFVSERAARDNQVEWMTGPEGIAAYNTGSLMFDGDEAQVQAYVAEQYATAMVTSGEAARLARDTTLMANQTEYSREAWNIYEDQFYNISLNSVTALSPHLQRLARGESVSFSEIEGFEALMGTGGSINANNIETVFAQYRHRLVQEMTRMMRSSDIATAAGAPRIGQPDSEYMDRILAPLDNVIAAFQADDPNAALERATSADTLSVYSRLNPQDRAGMALINLFSNNPFATDALVTTLEAGGLTERALAALAGVSSGDPTAALTPDEAADMSGSEAAETVTWGVQSLHEHIRSGNVDPETVQGLLTTITNAAGRAGSEIDPSVYRELFTPQAIEAIRSNRGATTSFSQFIQHDISSDWDELRQMMEGQFGSITFDGTRLVYNSTERTDNIGTTLGESSLSSGAQELLDTINEKLGVIQSTGIGEAFGESPEAFFEALTAGMAAQGGTGTPTETPGLEGQGASVANLEVWTNIYNSAGNATPIYEEGRVRAYATPGTTPLVDSMEGASSMTHGSAQSTMSQVLAGPFAALQERFGSAILINDAIARAGTSRETETPGSRHFHGDALDLNISGMSEEDQLRLVQEAMAVGFQGFGFGNGILHIDLGERRSWNYGNNTFAGVPVAEMQRMVADGTVPRPELLSGGGGPDIHPSTIAAITLPGTRTTPGADQREFDLGEGLSQGLTYYDRDPATVDQDPVGDLSVGDDPNREPTASEQGRPTAARPGNPQIERLIDEISGEVDLSNLDEDQLDEVRAAIVNALGMVPRQRPTQ